MYLTLTAHAALDRVDCAKPQKSHPSTSTKQDTDTRGSEEGVANAHKEGSAADVSAQRGSKESSRIEFENPLTMLKVPQGQRSQRHMIKLDLGPREVLSCSLRNILRNIEKIQILRRWLCKHSICWLQEGAAACRSADHAEHRQRISHHAAKKQCQPASISILQKACT